MPYLTQKDKTDLETRRPATSGELNYAITLLLRQFWVNSPRNYQSINNIVGAVEGAKQEFIRRVVNPYEDEKIKSNGDVYEGGI